MQIKKVKWLFGRADKRRGRKTRRRCDTIEPDCFSGKSEAAPVGVCLVRVCACTCACVCESLPVRQDVTVFEVVFTYVWLKKTTLWLLCIALEMKVKDTTLSKFSPDSFAPCFNLWGCKAKFATFVLARFQVCQVNALHCVHVCAEREVSENALRCLHT